MPDLTMQFEGMTLILNAGERSEAFFIDTNKVSVPGHHHQHRATVQRGQPTLLQDVLVWIEANGTRLEGPIKNSGSRLADLGRIAQNEPLKRTLMTDDPRGENAWLDLLAAWMRLPGGELTTKETDTPGGRATWAFPRQGSAEPFDQKLTETAILTRSDVTGPVQLVLQPLSSGDPVRIDVPETADGWFIEVSTTFAGIDPGTRPRPGEEVFLDEMKLLYACLARPERGRVPSTIWEADGEEALPFRFSDPITRICPTGFKG